MSSPFEMSDETPVYVISVAAELSGLHPQTLRTYDREGLVSPGRSAGGGRRYSLHDIVVLREVQRLSQRGVNLWGIKQILELEAELERFREALAEMTAQMEQARFELESTRAVAARLAGLLRGRGTGAELVPVHDPGMPGGQPGQRPTAAGSAGLRPAAAGGATGLDPAAVPDTADLDPAAVPDPADLDPAAVPDPADRGSA